MPSRRKTREFVLQVLYAADGGKQRPEETLRLLEKHFGEESDDVVNTGRIMVDFARELVQTVAENMEDIDAVIAGLSLHWKLHRIDRVDRNILRMAIAEMVGFPDIPGRVTINEAVDLGKKFGTESSSAFINGILDRIHAISFGPGAEEALAEIMKRLDEPSTTD